MKIDLTPDYTRSPHLICDGKTHRWDGRVQILEYHDSNGGRESHRLLDSLKKGQ